MTTPKKILPLVVCALLVGCDYTVPLVDSPQIAIDRAVLGLWQAVDDDDRQQRLLILPLGKYEYLVSFPAQAPEAMFARACLSREAGMTLVQLDWFGTAQAKLPEDKRTFQYASYTVDGNSLALRLLNPAVVPKDVASAERLAEAIAEKRNDPELFREGKHFRRLAD